MREFWSADLRTFGKTRGILSRKLRIFGKTQEFQSGDLRFFESRPRQQAGSNWRNRQFDRVSQRYRGRPLDRMRWVADKRRC
jgi:hypothetical protein